MTPATTAPLLEVKSLTKSFPGVKALRSVDLQLHTGEVLAVIGENGAGKSTLMKVLAGLQPPDSGQVFVEGQEVQIDSVKSAIGLGISLIHQELNLSGNLTIGANIFLGREPNWYGFIDGRTIHQQSQALLARVGLDRSSRTLVESLSIGQQQMVEIAKALSVKSRILIMDEPTSSLSQHETAQLHKVIRDCQAAGVSIIYISHRLGEVKEVADRVVVLRDGQNAGELQKDEINHDAMVSLMVGRAVENVRNRKPQAPGEVRLKAIGLRTVVHPTHTLDFEIRAGEIVGLAGLVGAGRTELLETIFGITPAIGGIIEVEGNPVRLREPQHAIAAGIAMVPEDRKAKGLVIDMDVRDNVTLASVRRDASGGFLNFSAAREISGEMREQLNVKTPNDRQIIRYLSGGNQQKVVLGKWLAMRPSILLLDEPTRGIDVGSKGEIYKLMEQLAQTGVAILFVSSEMEEILRMSDRALVMHEGQITGEIPRDQLSEEAIMRLATNA